MAAGNHHKQLSWKVLLRVPYNTCRCIKMANAIPWSWLIVTSSTIDIFFEITKFSKILSKLTLFSKIFSNFDKIFENFRKKCQFRKYFRKFCNFEKSAMVNEVNIRLRFSVFAWWGFYEGCGCSSKGAYLLMFWRIDRVSPSLALLGRQKIVPCTWAPFQHVMVDRVF